MIWMFGHRAFRADDLGTVSMAPCIAKRTRTVNLSAAIGHCWPSERASRCSFNMSNAPAIGPAARLLPSDMTVHLVNPSHLSFGVGVITPRWLFVLGAATPASYGTPLITDETLSPSIWAPFNGDVVGVGIHHRQCTSRIRTRHPREGEGVVIFGGIHATLYPDEALSLGGAHAVVKGDGDVIWPLILGDATRVHEARL